MKQIIYVKKNYRKLFSIIRDRKNELEENASDRERRSTSALVSSSVSAFVFVSASISTSVSASISVLVESLTAFVLASVSETSNVQRTQSNVHQFWQQQAESNLLRINQHWSISQRNQSSSYSEQFNESSIYRQEYDHQSESRNLCKKLVNLIKIYREEDKFKNKDDNFDFKIMIFYDKCNVIELFEHAYMQAVSIMLEERALSHFYSNRMYVMTFNHFCVNMKRYFEESKWQRHNLNKWHFMHIRDIIAANSSLSLSDCLQKLCENMNILQQDIDLKYHESNYLRENLIRACRDHSAFVVELHNSSIDFSIFVDSLCINIINWKTANLNSTRAYIQSCIDDCKDYEHCFTNRQYRRELLDNRDNDRFSSNFRFRERFVRASKICFVCDKSQCWSTNHIEKKREDSKKRFLDRNSAYKDRSEFQRRFEQYVIDYEDNEINEFTAQYFEELIIDDTSQDISINEFVTEINEFETFLIVVESIDDIETFTTIIKMLADKTFRHRLISENSITVSIVSMSYIYTAFIASRYDDREFKDILIDHDAADFFSEDIEQFTILQRISKKILSLNKNKIISFRFDIDKISFIDTVDLNTSVDVITFHIVLVHISFLLCLADMNRLRLYFNNLINMLIEKRHSNQVKSFQTQILMNLKSLIRNDEMILDLQIDMKIEHRANNFQIDLKKKHLSIDNLHTDMKKEHHSMIRRYDHAFLLWNIFAFSLIVESLNQNSCSFIEIELRRLHRRFDHFSTRRLQAILNRSDHDTDARTIEYLIKYCHHCQLHEKFSSRFSFTLKDDLEFNFNVIVDIFYIEIKLEINKSILHLVNEATRFQAGRWLKNITTRHVWNQLRFCWIDIYLESLDLITSDANKQFIVREFKQYASNMRIRINIVLVKTHHSIDMIERYHESLRRIYVIITAKIVEIDPNSILQMSFKTLNDSTDSDDLILTLLVFEAYLRMIEMNALSSTITQRSIAMRKTMNEVRKLIATRQLNDALNIRNDSSSILIHNLSLNSFVLVYRERNDNQSESWKDSFKLLNVDDESVIIELSSDSTKFRSTAIKSYYDDDHVDFEDSSLFISITDSSFIESVSSTKSSNMSQSNDQFAVSNDQKSESETLSNSSRRDRDRSRKYFASTAFLSFVFNTTVDSTVDFALASISLSAAVSKLDSIVHTALSQFAAFRQKEINELIEKDVFQSVDKNDVSFDVRIFNSRFVDEIKHLDTDKAFEKSRLVMQTFNDQNKNLVLIQSSTIQRVSQRLIVCFIAVFSEMNLYLRNITQTYVQSVTSLNRDFFVRSSVELIKHLDIASNSILKMIKSLYDVLEADNHWFVIYHVHHVNKLEMTQSTYDLCLLHTDMKIDTSSILRIDLNNDHLHTDMSIVDMQIDDTLMLIDSDFAAAEEKTITDVKIMIKSRNSLDSNSSLKFNDTFIERQENDIYLRQLSQFDHLQMIKIIDSTIISSKDKIRIALTSKKQYVAQRAREAYIVSICQSKAFFDLSLTAQSIEVSSEDITTLNKRLQWQIDNHSRDLRYVKLDSTQLQLIVFTNSSFANNRNLFSQIDYVICLADSKHANVVHWSSVKCKRVTRSVLAAELYALVHDFDLDAALKATLSAILDRFVSLVLCTDSKSLYDCLVKLDTIQKKRLMIDVMSLRQSYERRKITKIKWIHDVNNSIDFMIKSKAFTILKTLIDINTINMNIIEWIERSANKTDQ